MGQRLAPPGRSSPIATPSFEICLSRRNHRFECKKADKGSVWSEPGRYQIFLVLYGIEPQAAIIFSELTAKMLKLFMVDVRSFSLVIGGKFNVGPCQECTFPKLLHRVELCVIPYNRNCVKDTVIR
jgi:hypothetical protein